MNTLTARSAVALFLLLTALLLPLTCAAEDKAGPVTFIAYDQNGVESEMQADSLTVINNNLASFEIWGELDYKLDGYSSSDNPEFFYLDSRSSDLEYNLFLYVDENSSIICDGSVSVPKRIFLSPGSTLSFHRRKESLPSAQISLGSILLNEGATLNLNSANLKVEKIIKRLFNGGDQPAATVNIFGGEVTSPIIVGGGSLNVNMYNGKLDAYGSGNDAGITAENPTDENLTFNLQGGTLFAVGGNNAPGIGDGVNLIISGGEAFITGYGGHAALECASLTFSPSGENEYIRVYDGADRNTRKLIGAYNQSNSGGALETLRDYAALSMDKAVMSTIEIDQAPQTYRVDESPCFKVEVLTEGVSPSSFNVEYKQNGSYSTNPPTQPGTYDVRITRPLDDTYLPFDEVIVGGLVIKHSQTAPTGVTAVAETIRYKNDGRLTGVTAAMEYRAKDSAAYTAVTGTEVTDLAPGNYFVRYRETATHFASGEVEVEVASGRAAYDTDSTQSAKGISADNVQPENEALLRQALSDYQSALDTFGSRFAETEKQEIQAEMERIRSALQTLERAAAMREAIAALPDAVEPDDTDAAARILAAKADFDALTAHERALVGEAPTAKLDSLTSMLSAYRITYGDGASLVVGQNTTLSFTANGPLSKLTAVLVDGKMLDTKHYTAESGSTIITLAADYVKTLAVGEHTLTVCYTDGETSARFTVTAMPQDLPQTGDSSSLTGWLALLGACCAGLWCLNRRRG